MIKSFNFKKKSLNKQSIHVVYIFSKYGCFWFVWKKSTRHPQTGIDRFFSKLKKNGFRVTKILRSFILFILFIFHYYLTLVCYISCLFVFHVSTLTTWHVLLNQLKITRMIPEKWLNMYVHTHMNRLIVFNTKVWFFFILFCL